MAISQQTLVEIVPLRVDGLNQLDLPLPLPVFDLLFAPDGLFDRCAGIKPDQRVHAVLLGEAFDQIIPVLIDTSHEIVCDAHIQGAISLARHDVNIERHAPDCDAAMDPGSSPG